MTSSNSRGAKLSEVLAELKAEYRQKFPEKLAKLRALHADQDWAALKEEFHKLKGTGRTYGYPEVSQLCEALEQLCGKPSVSASLVEKCFPVFEKMLTAWQDGHLYDLSLNEDAQEILEGA